MLRPPAATQEEARHNSSDRTDSSDVQEFHQRPLSRTPAAGQLDGPNRQSRYDHKIIVLADAIVDVVAPGRHPDLEGGELAHERLANGIRRAILSRLDSRTNSRFGICQVSPSNVLASACGTQFIHCSFLAPFLGVLNASSTSRRARSSADSSISGTVTVWSILSEISP